MKISFVELILPFYLYSCSGDQIRVTGLLLVSAVPRRAFLPALFCLQFLVFVLILCLHHASRASGTCGKRFCLHLCLTDPVSLFKTRSHVTEDGPGTPTSLLPLLPLCWDCRCVTNHPVYGVLGIACPRWARMIPNCTPITSSLRVFLFLFMVGCLVN